jgi:predicted Zn finger-like uncharacterized protein
MPLQTACSACSAKIKVKDELIGKLIKCPKCGEKFKAAAEETKAAVTAAAIAKKPETKKPPPAWADDEDEDDKAPAWDKNGKNTAATKPKPPGKKAAAKDDDDDDDEKDPDEDFDALLSGTQLPESTKKLVQGELGLREKGVWVGQPCPKIMTVRAIPKALGAVVAVTIACIVLGAIGGSAIEGYGIFVGLAAAVLWVIAAPLLGGIILFMDRRAALATAYVVTNKRCIVFTGKWFFSPGLESFYPDLLAHMRRMGSWIFGGDAGDLVFRSVTTITTTHSRRHGTSTSVSTVYYGFLGIRSLDEIERVIRQTLLTDDDDDDDDDDDEDDRKKKKKKKVKAKKTRKDDVDDDD